jgi:hypothetical protein
MPTSVDLARALVALLGLAAAACGDNDPGVGPPIAPAESLFVVAHLDDDMIFMQPELVEAIGRGSTTTIYMLSGDPVRGNGRARFVFEATMLAYEHVAGSGDWACGSLHIGDLPVHHCRLRDRSVSMIGLDVEDGGLGASERLVSLLSLLEGKLPSVPVHGPIGGEVTVPALVDEVAQLIALTAPSELHILDIAADHGGDHAGHLMAAGFALWGAAQAGYTGTLVSHRGYSVDGLPITLSDADYARAKPMLGYFEACYFGCGPCGTECPTIEEKHHDYLLRQYASAALPGDPTTRLESIDAPGSCIAATSGGLGVADCGDPAALTYDSDRHLHGAGLCAASGPANDDPIALVACASDPAQYWIVDDEGLVANGRPPLPAPDMRFNHTRCLQAAVGAAAGAPVCGKARLPRWRIKTD